MLIMPTESLPPFPIMNLDIYDEPTREYLVSYITVHGHSPSQLDPIIYAAIDKAKELVFASKASAIPQILLNSIKKHASVFVDAVLSQNRKWRACRSSITSFRSILVAGAGVSFGSDMPLAKLLTEILKFCGATDWEDLRQDVSKRKKFQEQFKLMCDDRTPSTSHTLIMKNFTEYILEIICFNWDDLFERSSDSLGTNIDKINEDNGFSGIRHLWKFHGDIQNLKTNNIKGKGGWVFPDEDGFVFQNFKQYLGTTKLRDNLFTLLIIGYNESEKEVYKNIIALLEKIPPRPTYRVGLDLDKLSDDYYIVGTSDYILDKILPVN